jgi:hypothetical protein
MNVMNLLTDVSYRPEIPVIAAAALPETALTLAIRLTILQAAEETHGMGANP